MVVFYKGLGGSVCLGVIGLEYGLFDCMGKGVRLWEFETTLDVGGINLRKGMRTEVDRCD